MPIPFFYVKKQLVVPETKGKKVIIKVKHNNIR